MFGAADVDHYVQTGCNDYIHVHGISAIVPDRTKTPVNTLKLWDLNKHVPMNPIHELVRIQ